MAIAWLVTLPIAALVGAAAFAVAHWIGGTAGVIAVFFVLLAGAATMFGLSRKTRVHPGNVIDDWDGQSAPSTSQPATTCA